MVQRFDGRVGSEVLGGKTPDQVVAERLRARRKLARARPEGRVGPEDMAMARRIAEAANEVSQPDIPLVRRPPCPVP